MKDRHIDQAASGLPRELLPASRAGRIWLSLALATALFLLLNSFSHWLLDTYSPNKGYQVIQAKWRLLNNLQQPVDILVLGDSSGNHGVDTDYLSEKTGLTAVNLATTGTILVVNSYLMLKDYISRFGAPRCVITFHVYDIWQRGIGISAFTQIKRPTLEMLVDMVAMEVSEKKRLAYLAGRWFPVLTQDISIREILKYPWRQEAVVLPTTVSGFFPFHKADPEHVKNDIEKHKNFVKKNDFRASHENTYALEQLSTLADKHDFPFYLVNSPMVDRLFADENLQRYLNEVNLFLRQQTSDYQNVQHVFATPITFDMNEMENADHLTAEAAKRFTAKLINEVSCLSAQSDK